MSILDKKEGGTKVGNILRGLKNVGLPIAELADKLVLGGKASEIINMIKGDNVTVDNTPLSPEVVESILVALNEDIQDARDHADTRLSSTTIPTPIKYVPSVIDLMVIIVWAIVALYMVYSVINFAIDGTSGGAAVTAMAIFTAVSSKADNVINFYRGGNNEEQHGFIGKLLGKN